MPRAPAPHTPVPRAPAPHTLVPRAPAPHTPVPRAPAPHTPAPPVPAPHTPVPRAPALRAPALQAPVLRAPAVRAPAARAPALRAPAPQALVPLAPAVRARAPRASAPRAPAKRAPALQGPVLRALAPRAPAPRAPVPLAPAVRARAPRASAPRAPALQGPVLRAPSPRAQPAPKIHEVSLRTLEEDGLLDDEIINAYLAALTSGTGGKVLGFSVFWLPVMKSLHWPTDAVQNTLQERGAAAAQVWIMPYNRSGIHWAQFIVFRAAKRIYHLDSFLFGAPADALRLVQLLLECVQPEASPIDWAEWDLVVPENTPLQEDGSSCGVHVCWHARAAATAVPTAAPLDVSSMRDEIRQTVTGVSSGDMVSVLRCTFTFRFTYIYFYNTFLSRMWSKKMDCKTAL